MFHYIMIVISMFFLMFSMLLFNKSMFLTMDLPLISLMSMTMSFSMLVDWYSLMFGATVLFISSMILVFSLFYIPKKEFKQFSTIMMMFVMSMLILIFSDNIIFMLLGWDGLGLSSFILVIYYQNFSSSSSGAITIFSNRLGDIAILISMSILTMKFNWNYIYNEEFPSLVMIMLLIASISKSAQFPFSSWLPAAMAAPTPISALVHSSTLVTAGVFLMIRTMNFPHPNTMMTLMMIATATTIYASMTANWEQDMKKIIALSTLSQIGMMMFAISIMSHKIAFFHLIVHAMFKSMMFLSAGMMIHSFMYQDMRNMMLMKNLSPMMFMVISISTMTLMGLPFMSGFFSKDSIIEFMINSKMFSLLSTIMIISIGMTSAYSIRMIKLATKMVMKNKPDNLFANSNIMEIPMLIMIPFSIFLGAILMWIMFPLQIFLFPNSIKMMIILSMMMGIITSVNMNFFKNNFLIWGYYSISLWFLNMLSTHFSYILTPFMKIMQKNDKSWQEIYGPQNSYNLLKNKILNPEMSLNLPSFLLMIIMISPMMVILVM